VDHQLVRWEKNHPRQPALTLSSYNTLSSLARTTAIPAQSWDGKLRGAQLQGADQGSGLGKIQELPYEGE